MNISLDISIPYYKMLFRTSSFVTFNIKKFKQEKRMPDLGLEPWTLWLEARLQNHCVKEAHLNV